MKVNSRQVGLPSYLYIGDRVAGKLDRSERKTIQLASTHSIDNTKQYDLNQLELTTLNNNTSIPECNTCD